MLQFSRIDTLFVNDLQLKLNFRCENTLFTLKKASFARFLEKRIKIQNEVIQIWRVFTFIFLFAERRVTTAIFIFRRP